MGEACSTRGRDEKFTYVQNVGRKT